MGSKYIPISREEFDTFMKQSGFECINPDALATELQYRRMWNSNNYVLKVFSSIVPSGISASVKTIFSFASTTSRWVCISARVLSS